ncbi:hypothetical protein [uncultured Massilia sp.]|uniref:hypothetical protein n=1 Tax=uncultured Massilia sp. TaxID=169973 RepID=UPI0025E77A75|nr:hypothetical protein [uncultured Massilia sp.]
MKNPFIRLLLACLLAALAPFASAQISNTASVTYADPARADASLRSNTVTAAVPAGAMADTIEYFTGADFRTRARVTMTGMQLYVQATASACNADPMRAETVVISIQSSRTGDTQGYPATETGPNTGIFRIASPAARTTAPSAAATGADDGAGGKKGTSGAGAGATSQEGAVAAMADDTLVASVASCGKGLVTTSILVDPRGIVFDSATGLPLAGARVTLIDVTGAGNGGIANGAAAVFDVDGTTPYPSTVVSASDGSYRFPLVAPSLYKIQVVAPTNYTFPSRVEPGKLPSDRDIHLYGSFGGEFTVSVETGAVSIDLPLDPVPGMLYLEKMASRSTAEIADFVDYTIRVHNSGDQDLGGVAVDDALPAGFRYEPGTLRLDGAVRPDPSGSAGRLHADVGTVPAGGVAVLRYRVRIGAGALQGDGINRAVASSRAPLALVSSVAAAKVKVLPGVFSEKGFIVGSVFADCDGDGLRGPREPGIAGVRVWLEDGSWSQTDAEGRYSFADVRPRTHIAKLDGATLPEGAELQGTSQRNAGDPGSLFVDLKDGELAKADFAVAGCSADLRGAIAARRQAARAALEAAARLADQAATAAAQASARQPAPAAAVALDQLDNTLAFVGLEDGAVLAQAQANVRVKGTAGSTFTLAVNGVDVPDGRIGQRNTVASRQMQSWEYVGVALQPGRNTLELRQKDQFGNARGSRSIAVMAPGALARIRLELENHRVAADGRALALLHVRLEDAHGVPVAERTPLTLEAARGAWLQADLDPREAGLQAFVEGGSADFALRAPLEAGDVVVRAASGTVQAQAELSFVPDLRPLVAAGVVDTAIGLNRVKGNVTDPVRAFDGFEDALRHVSNGNTEIGGRAAMFAKGKVAKDTLLTLSYDSDKVSEQKLFRDLDPNAYYPAYGDDAQRGFDAQSTSRLYLRADHDKSWVMYGDITPPGATPARNLGAYNRALTGLRQHYESGNLLVDAFASRDSSRQMVEEIAANGTSGPYNTGSGVMVINSERIEIVVRDRNQTGVILSRKAQQRYVDYDIEPLTGRILFRAPVASLDEFLNPVSVRISYEIDQGSPRFWTAGVAAQYRVGKFAEIGGAYVDDRNPAAPSTLASLNATVRPDDKTTVIVEGARMDRAGIDGNAARFEAVRVDGKLESRVFGGRADLNFDNPSANLPRGRVEAGARLRWQATDKVVVAGEALHTEDLTSGARRDGVQVSAGYAFGNGVRVEAGVRRAHETAGDAATVLAQPDLTSVRAKVAAQVPGLPQAGVYAEAEQDVRDSGRRMLALGGDYRFAGGSRVYGRHELISSLVSNYALNDGQQRNATVFGIDTDYMKDGRMFSEYRARGADLGFAGAGGRQAEAALGLRNLWQIADGVRGSTSVERVRVLSGSAANEAVAVAGAIEYSRTPALRANARLELRHAQDSDNVLSTLGLAYRLSETWSFLGKNTLAASRSRATDAMRVNELLQSGVAYRALETLGWNGLAKYEYKLERDDGLAAMKRAVHTVAVNANWQPTRETVFSARYAAKHALDRSAGLPNRAIGQLASARVTHQLGADWDVGVVGQVLVSGARRARQFGAGIEAGYQLRTNTWVSAGYNVLGFRERDLAEGNATAKGLYVRLRMKFDERTLENLLSPNASH